MESKRTKKIAPLKKRGAILKLKTSRNLFDGNNQIIRYIPEGGRIRDVEGQIFVLALRNLVTAVRMLRKNGSLLCIQRDAA